MLQRKYEFEHIRYDDLKKNITLPQFQRSLVWSKPQKEQFLQTVREGKPFGSILVYKHMDKYEIIDGLQRFTTLRNYEDNPAEYIEINCENFPQISDIANIIKKLIPSIQIDLVERRIIDNIKQTLKEISLNDEKLIRIIRDKIVEHYGDETISRQNCNLIEDYILDMAKIWRTYIDFRQLKIPTIIFTGEQSELPDIFEKLNTGGTKLSRYEVFASTWNSILLKIDKVEYLDYIEELYKKKSERTNLAISNYEEGIVKKKKVISLYELCFAFGKKIKNTCPILFSTYSETEEDQVDSIGFTSLATVLGLSLKQLATLNKYINENTNINNLMQLMDKIICSYVQIEKILKNYISTVDNKVFTKFIEAQVLAIVGTQFKLLYIVNKDLSLSNANTSKTVKEGFKRFMPFTYLYDIIAEFWAGSGDRKLAEELEKPLTENRYTSLILPSKWENLLIEWMTNQITKKPKNVAIENKLFINFITKNSLDWSDNQTTYDIEHIIPKKRIADKNLNVAISAIGNLCLLPTSDNRRKKDETLYEFLDRVSGITYINEEKALNLHYPTRDELSFIRAGSDFNEENYETFLHGRHNYLIRKFKEIIKLL